MQKIISILKEINSSFSTNTKISFVVMYTFMCILLSYQPQTLSVVMLLALPASIISMFLVRIIGIICANIFLFVLASMLWQRH